MEAAVARLKRDPRGSASPLAVENVPDGKSVSASGVPSLTTTAGHQGGSAQHRRRGSLDLKKMPNMLHVYAIARCATRPAHALIDIATHATGACVVALFRTPPA